MTPLFLILFLSGVILILMGLVMLKFPPKKINHWYGYRTNSSMKTPQRWEFAQKYSAYEAIKLGTLLSVSSVLGLLFKINDLLGTLLGIAIFVVIIIVFIVRVEKAIKERFKDE